MPRMPRRDAPGVVHHVTLRGVAQCDIFVDDVDRAFLVDRFAVVAAESSLTIYAFAFMSNHVHVVVKTGATPLALAMLRVNTAYAQHFNRRHGRVGHLFQNRYHASLIEGDAHLRNAIRYAHANPLEAGLLRSLDELDRYPWTGHASLIGTAPLCLVDVRATLELFGGSAATARTALRKFMREWRQPAARNEEAPLAPLSIPALEAEIARVSREFGVDPAHVRGGSRRRIASRARAEIARAAALGGLPACEVALALGVTHASILRAAERARATGRARGVPTSRK